MISSIVLNHALDLSKVATTLVHEFVAIHAFRNVEYCLQDKSLFCRAATSSQIRPAGKPSIHLKLCVSRLCRKRYQVVGMSFRLHATLMLPLEIIVARRDVTLYWSAVITASDPASYVDQNWIAKMGCCQITESVDKIVDEPSTLVVTHVVDLVMQRNLARPVMKLAILLVFIQNAIESVTSHAYLVLKTTAGRLAPTVNAACHAPHHAIGFRVASDVRRVWIVVISVHPSAVRFALLRTTAKYVQRTRPNSNVLTYWNLPAMVMLISMRVLASFLNVVISPQLAQWMV